MILLLDANETIKNENLTRSIRSDPKLNMKDPVRERALKDGPATWFRGTKQIDGVFFTPDMDFCGARFIHFWSGMGDHNAVVVDIPHYYLLGEQLLKVIRLEARRLQLGLTGPKRWYLQKCKTLFKDIKFTAS